MYLLYLGLLCDCSHFWQIKVLDMLNQERTTAERKIMTYKIEQRLAQGREEALMTQV